jgi:hypothetical protein
MRYRSRLVRRAMILAPLLLLVLGATALVSARREQAKSQQAQAEVRKAKADAQAATLRKL